MKRVVAALLRHRTVWQLVAITAACTSLALFISYYSYASTVKRLAPVIVVLYGTAGAALILAAVRNGEDIERSGEAGRRWRRFVLVVLGLAAVIAYVTYSFGYHRRTMISSCNASLLPDTLAERQAALVAAEATLHSPFALLPRLHNDAAGRECERSRADLDRVQQGLCTQWVLKDLACACGAERYPYARCEEPRCLYEPGKPDIFDCVGDPLPEGYSNF